MRCILVISFFSSVSMSFAQEWLTLTPDPSYTSFNNAQCIEAVGNFIHVVYTEGVESKEQVYYTRSNSNFYYWETNKVISGTRKGAYPSISVSGDIVHVVFVEPWYGGGIYYTRSDDNGDSWEDPVLLTSTHAEIAFPSLAVSGQTLHLVWQDRREISSEIYYKKSEDGGHTWTDDRKLTNTEQESISPCVAVDSSNVHLVWKDDDGVHYQQSVDGGNTWAGDVLLAWLGDQPTITVSGNLVMVLWADNRDGSADIYLRRSLDSGHVWEDEIQPVAHINPASSPRVASSGNFCYLVWNEMVDHTWSILTSFSTNGGLTWYYPERSNISSGFAIRPFVAIHDKDVHIICTEKDLLNGNQEIRYAHEKNVFPDFSHNSFEWGFGYVSTSDECGQALITDDAGNVYVTGYFSKTIDFDPGPGVYNMMSVGGGYDIFIEKFNASGQLMWAHRAGNSFHDAANAVTLDAHGNVFVAGYFSGKVDFDPGPSVYELQSAGVQDIFILKLDPGGNFIWARRMGGSGTDIANSIAIDSSGRIITVGSFSEVADFNPGTGINNLTSNGMVDIFISVLDRNGLFVDAQSFGGPEYDYASAVITDTSNSIFVTGTFGDTIDFDFGTDIHMLSSNGKNDIFLLKLNAAGKWEWSKSVGSAGNDNSSAMVIDRDGNIYMCGSFSKEMDIDPGPGVVWLDLYGGIFILKLDADGQYEWSTAFGGFGNASGIALDDFHNVYVTGGFQYLNIGRSFQNQYLESFESDDVFTLKVNPKGVLVWIDVMSGLSYAEGCGIAIYSNTDIYVTGQYYESLDLDPSIDLHLLESPAGSYRDFFIIKTRQCAPVYNTITATACEFYWAPDGYTHWTTSGTYQEVLLTNEGCDSVLTVNLTILNPTSGEEVITACDQYISPKGNIWNASGVYHETLTNGAGCDSIVTYYLTINQHSENENQITACNAYTTPDGKHTWTSSGTEQDVFTAASGCDSVVIYSVTILHDQENNVSISSCDTYTTPDGSQTWSASGTYQYILPAIGGCDSIITVALTITTFDLSVIENDASLTANQSDANYQWIDCNSGLTLEDETSQNFHPKHNGSYAVIIERNSCLDTSDCFVVTSVGIHDLPFSEVIKIYPNPVHDIMYISFNKPWQHIAIEMTDVFGRVVYDTSYTDVQQIRIQPGLMDGVYFIKMATDGKEAVFKVVLE